MLPPPNSFVRLDSHSFVTEVRGKCTFFLFFLPEKYFSKLTFFLSVNVICHLLV